MMVNISAAILRRLRPMAVETFVVAMIVGVDDA